jgi:hypothetical protein
MRWRALPLAEIVLFHSTPICRLLISVSAFNFRVDGGLGEITVRCQAPPTTQIAQFCVQPRSNFYDPPCTAASFEVNSELHTGARPSVRLCVRLINMHTHNYINGIRCTKKAHGRGYCRFKPSSGPGPLMPFSTIFFVLVLGT